MFLTESELFSVTGRQQPSAQVRWLRVNGWVFEVAGTGRPLVSRSYAEKRLGGSATDAPAPIRPDFSAI